MFHQLEEYLRFRHLVRNIYGFQLEYERFRHLIGEFPEVADKSKTQINEFLNIMENIINKIDNNDA